MQKTKKRKWWRTILVMLCIIAITICAVMAYFTANSPQNIVITGDAFNLATIADGTYTGSCDNGLVKVKLDVIVQNHAITGILILEHQKGLGGSAEAITSDVIDNQSIEVDTIAGATYSSQTILKAIENALAGA